jgi:hypothetical protein
LWSPSTPSEEHKYHNALIPLDKKHNALIPLDKKVEKENIQESKRINKIKKKNKTGGIGTQPSQIICTSMIY